MPVLIGTSGMVGGKRGRSAAAILEGITYFGGLLLALKSGRNPGSLRGVKLHLSVYCLGGSIFVRISQELELVWDLGLMQ